MRRIRIGNDFQIRWAIEREGIPEALDTATDMQILVELNYLCSSNQRINKPLTTFTVDGNFVFMDFPAEFCTQYGDYRIIMRYTIPDSGMIDGDRKIVTDITPFTIVGASEDADSSADFFVDTDIVTGFKGDDGLSSFEVWLLDNPTGTIDEYWDFIKMPNEGFLEGLVDYLDDPTNNIQGISTPELSSATGTITISAGTTVKGNVDTRNSTFYADSIRLNTSATPTFAPGEIGWNADEQTVEIGLPDGGSQLVGKEMFEIYVNVDTVPITDGMIVSTAAIPGNRKGVKRTDFTSLTSIRSIVGMVTVASIGTNQSGRVATKGVVHGLNTALYPEGSQLWGNPSVLGGWSGSKPAKPQYAVQIGQVVVAHAAVGSVELNIAKDVKFSDLADVNGSTNLIDNADAIPKRDADGIIREISVADIKADFKADTDLIYEPLLGFIPEDSAAKGQANGYASLDGDGLVPASQLPSFVDDIVDAYGTYTDVTEPKTIIELWTTSAHDVPVDKYTGKIYVDVVTRFQFRWSGSVWGAILSGPVQSVAGKTGNVLLVKADVGLGNVDNTSDVNKPVSTLQAAAIATKVGLTGNETIAGVKTFSSSPIVPNPTTAGQALNKGTADGAYVALTGAQNIAGVKTFTDSPVVPSPVNNTDAANKAYVQSIITVGNDTYQENKLITDARVASLENTINSANINQETTATVTGVDTVALPKTAANTGMQVQLFGQSAQNLVVDGKLITATSFAHNSGRKIDVILGNKYYARRLYQTISGTDGTATGRVVTILPEHTFVSADDTLSRISTYNSESESGKIVYTYGPQWGTTLGEFRDIMIINLTATFGAGNEPTKEQCDLLFANYFEGSDNVLGTGRIRSVNSDGMLPSYLYLTAPELRSNGLTKDEIRKGTNGYELVKRVGVGSSNGEIVINGGFDSTENWTVQGGTSNISGGTLKLIADAGVGSNATQSKTITAGRIYRYSISIISNSGTVYLYIGSNSARVIRTLDGTGLITGFFTAPTNGTFIRLIKEVATAANMEFDNLSIVEYNPTEGAATAGGEVVFGNSVHYTLANPVITPIPHAGLLNSNSNGTAYFEPIIADAGVYGSNLSVQLTDYPIASFESIRKYANGTYTELNTATAVIASGGLSFTHPDLASGDLVMFTYAYSKESIGRSMTLTHYDSRFVVKDTANANVYRITPTITNGVLTWTLTLV